MPDSRLPDSYRYRQAWNATLVFAVLILTSQVLTALSPIAEESQRTRFFEMTSFFLSGGYLLSLPIIGKRWTPRGMRAVYFLICASLSAAMWTRHITYLQLSSPWVPLMGSKLLFLALAIMIPGSYLFSAALLALSFAETLVLWFSLDIARNSYVIKRGEPVVTTIYALLAACLLAFRMRDDLTIRRLMASEARARALEETARVFLSIRDRSNTPLQTLALQTELLKRAHPDSKKTVLAMEENFNRLKEMNRLLTRLEERIDWRGKALMSDAELQQWLSSADEQKPD